MAYKETADVAGSNPRAQKLATPAMSATRISRPIMQANAEPIRSPLNGGGASGNRGGGSGRSSRSDPEAGNKPLNGSISRPNVKKKDGLNFRSNMMAGASASAGRAQQRKPMPKSRSTSRERTK